MSAASGTRHLHAANVPTVAAQARTEVEPVVRWAVVYLAMPAFVYLSGFVLWGWAVPMLLALFALTLRIARPNCAIPRSPAAICLLGALVLLGLIGMPGGPYPWDWIKHWAMINTLADEPWPVVLPLREEPLHLRFYIGAYLVPAALAKLFGLSVLVGTAIWFGSGFALLFRVVMLYPGPVATWRAGLLLPALLMLAGADAWASIALRAQAGLPAIGVLGFHPEWWTLMLADYPLQYTSLLALLVWVPHQSVATLLVTALILTDRGPQCLARWLLATGLLALWSPYGLVGALPLLALRMAQCWREGGAGFGGAARALHVMRSTAAIGAVVGGGFALLVAAALTHQLPPSLLCLECVPMRVLQPERYALFWGVELVVPALLLRGRLWTDPVLRLSFLMLLLLPLIAGPTPDPVMRISMAPIFTLMLASAQSLLCTRDWRGLVSATLAVAASLPTTVGEVSYHLSHGQAHAAMPPGDPLGASWYSTFATTHQVTMREFFEVCGWRWLPQYFTPTKPPTLRSP